MIAQRRAPMRSTSSLRLCSCWTVIAALGLAPAVLTGVAAAQTDYPARAIRIIAITQAGGPSDLSARFVGDRLTAAWGQPVVVESRIGAGGSLAAGYVAKAAPDGYTLLMSGDAAIVTNLSL